MALRLSLHARAAMKVCLLCLSRGQQPRLEMLLPRRTRYVQQPLIITNHSTPIDCEHRYS